MQKAKYWYYRHYGWLIPLFFVLTVVLPMMVGLAQRLVPTITLILVWPALFFFTQKQQIEDQKLSVQLQTKFNRRYAALQVRLQAIYFADPSMELTTDQITTLTAYFNLCGEEFQHYQDGLITPRVWQAWVSGMRVYYYHPQIRRLWDRELKSESYYGFSASLIQ